ncbi:HNH endonuclease signature motif containing protein [Mumia sp. Pv 4-285]|uniref:HNH endonuclease signature motif containing protein n=1 Tax=Mumia qirimensis TaxID=3234852 RepID=UPI00351D9398
MTSIGGYDPGHLTEVARRRAAAEAEELAALLAADDAAHREAATLGSALQRQLHVRAARMEIAVATRLSEGQLRSRLSEARDVRDRLPTVWAAHGEGRLDGYRVHLVAEALARLEREASVVRLDASVVAYASSHTASELRAWLRRFVARAEPDVLADRAARGREDRQVRVQHGDDGMSELWALLPTLQAATIDARLRREAGRLADAQDPAADPAPRTLAQKRADLLVAWTTGLHATADETPAVRPSVDVAVVMTAEALAGESDEPVVSSDGAWVVPAQELRDLLAGFASANLFWHRLLNDRAGRTLDHTYLGRFAPDLLARAVRLRDGVCQAPGCTVPAERCDLDHRVPWPRGDTSGGNIWPLCRRHHQLKSHGYLVPTTRDGPDHPWRLPSGRVVATERVSADPAEPTAPVTADSPASRLEGHLKRLVDLHAAAPG